MSRPKSIPIAAAHAHGFNVACCDPFIVSPLFFLIFFCREKFINPSVDQYNEPYKKQRVQNSKKATPRLIHPPSTRCKIHHCRANLLKISFLISKELVTTLILLSAMAAPAIMGLSNHPVNG